MANKKAPAAAPAPDRINDKLLTFPDEVCALTRNDEATERWLRAKGRAPYLFRRGRRLVAWRSDVIADIERARLADQLKMGKE